MKKCCNEPHILTDENNVGYCQNCHKEIPKPKMGEVDMLFVRTKDFYSVNKTTKDFYSVNKTTVGGKS